jgi:hypothetical protein
MVANGPLQFTLTLKGVEELSTRTYRLDVRLRNILFLVQKGSATFEAILQNSIFPQEEVLERVRGLINDKFIALTPAGVPTPAAPTVPAGAAAAPNTVAPAAAPSLAATQTTSGLRAPTRIGGDAFPALEAGISLSQARFVLCDFCLDEFGAGAPEKTERINAATALGTLQRALDDIYEELRAAKRQEAIAQLADRVKEINDTKV